jgi:hypothetical protein
MLNQPIGKPTKGTIIFGGMQDIYGRVVGYVSVINTLMLAGVFYNTVIIKTPWLNWMSVPLFIAIGIVTVFTLSVLVWKLIIPRMIAYGNYQGYKHSNPLRDDVKKLDDKLNLIMKYMNVDEKHDV